MDLSRNELSGEIPIEIWDLTNLKTLLLSKNNLRGEFPTEISNLTNLTELGLSFNQFRGNIPENICNYNLLLTDPNNKMYGISHNHFCPPYPDCLDDDDTTQYTWDCNDIVCDEGYVELWGVCYHIETTDSIDLTDSGITGEIPTDIGSLTNLTHLNLYYNQLTGEIPSEIGELINLTYLDLKWNQLTGEIPVEIGNLTSLTNLSLHNNKLTGEIPPEIGNLLNLESLYLYDNQLNGDVPSEFGNLTNIETIKLTIFSYNLFNINNIQYLMVYITLGCYWLHITKLVTTNGYYEPYHII